jgi:two-component system NtrC family sensor kinase
VARTARLTPTHTLSAVSAPLALLAAIAARLAHDEPVEDMLPKLLGQLCRELEGTSCALWLHTTAGLTRAWHVGGGEADPSKILAALERGGAVSGGPTVAGLTQGERRLGALSLQPGRELTVEERVAFAAVGDLLVPVLTSAEHSHQLAVEVALRTEEIEEQRRFTEKIIDSLPVGLYVIDREYRIHAWNRKRETGMQGVSREEAIGRPIFEILHRQPPDRLRKEFDDVFTTGRIQQFQMESTSTGELRTYRISKIPMRLDDGSVTHVITIGEDITDWRQAQDRIAQAEKLAAIGTLAAGVMHEINNPLATIGACAESIALRLDELRLERAQRAQFDDYIEIVDSEVHRCKRIIDGLLDFSRPKQVTKTRLDINAVIEETLFLLKHHAQFKRMAVQRELDAGLGAAVLGSAEQLIQVFMALLLNATDAMGGQGTITLRTRRGRGTSAAVVAEVIDAGHGIARGEIYKIFEPFYTTKPPGRGTGLGLSVCYGIVADHGGRIEVDSVVGKGSTFRIILPEDRGP